MNSESRAQLFCFHKVPNDVILNSYLLILNCLTCLGQVTSCSLASLHCLGSLASPAGILTLKVLLDPTWVYQVQGPFKQKYILSPYTSALFFNNSALQIWGPAHANYYWQLLLGGIVFNSKIIKNETFFEIFRHDNIKNCLHRRK